MIGILSSSSIAFVSVTAVLAQQGEAKAMLERAAAAVKADKAKAIKMFINGEGGFKDRDLFPFAST